MFDMLLFFLFPLSIAEPLSYEENRVLQETCGNFKSLPEDGMRKRFSMNTPNATRFEAPWAVNIRIFQSEEKTLEKSKMFCSGTLISPRHLITAAHCVFQIINGVCELPSSPPKMHVPISKYIVVPSTACSIKQRFTTCDPETKKYARVKKIFVYKQYAISSLSLCNKNKIHGDIALFELEEDFKLSDVIQPACYNAFPTRINETLTLFGYGNQEDEDFFGIRNATGSGVLRKHTSRYLSHTECRKLEAQMPPTIPLRIDVICSRHEEAMSCKGDSGSGMIYYKNGRAYLTGVLSYGPLCDLNMPQNTLMDYSQNVLYHLYWICAVSGVCPEGLRLTEALVEITKNEYYLYERY